MTRPKASCGRIMSYETSAAPGLCGGPKHAAAHCTSRWLASAGMYTSTHSATSSVGAAQSRPAASSAAVG